MMDQWGSGPNGGLFPPQAANAYYPVFGRPAPPPTYFHPTTPEPRPRATTGEWRPEWGRAEAPPPTYQARTDRDRRKERRSPARDTRRSEGTQASRSAKKRPRPKAKSGRREHPMSPSPSPTREARRTSPPASAPPKAKKQETAALSTTALMRDREFKDFMAAELRATTRKWLQSLGSPTETWRELEVDLSTRLEEVKADHQLLRHRIHKFKAAILKREADLHRYVFDWFRWGREKPRSAEEWDLAMTTIKWPPLPSFEAKAEDEESTPTADPADGAATKVASVPAGKASKEAELKEAKPAAKVTGMVVKRRSARTGGAAPSPSRVTTSRAATSRATGSAPPTSTAVVTTASEEARQTVEKLLAETDAEREAGSMEDVAEAVGLAGQDLL